MADGKPSARKSDLGVRTASAVVMLAVAGGALWAGGWFWAALCLAVALGVVWEWTSLVRGFTAPGAGQALWVLAGLIYVGGAVLLLFSLHGQLEGSGRVLILIGAVIGTDIGAYFAGRAIGGPKIAPAISPSKTWAGLFGGIIGAAALLALFPLAWEGGLCRAFYPAPAMGPNIFVFDGPCSGIFRLGSPDAAWALAYGTIIAVVAQAGDFFESWMKRRAGVKDSGKLIPGHGGLFDRVDGLLAVCFVMSVLKFGFGVE